jgi:hypothetical protein
VAIAGTRIAPVTAHSIGSINQIAPGRTFLGIGTGHTAMRVSRQDPRDKVPASRPPLHQSRQSHPDLCRCQRPQGMRGRRRVWRWMDHDRQDHRRPGIPPLAYSDRR